MSTILLDPPAAALPDVQREPDLRRVAIDRVGVSAVRHPVVVRDGGAAQHTIATLSLTVDLPHHVRGTHMSRFLQVLNRHDALSADDAVAIAEETRAALDAETAHVSAEFPFFVRRAAPVSGGSGMMEFTAGVEAAVGPDTDVVLKVRVPVATLCPCSREISERGAHNQRGIVSLDVRTRVAVSFGELIEAVEEGASCALYPVLKRADEKWVTERAYDNARFVEDLLREVAVAMREDPRVTWYRVTVENHESIHAHNAFATVERWK
jgi:GTP cyclohydrolase I